MTSSARGSDGRILLMRIVLGIALLALWELLGRTYGSAWTSLPSLVAERLLEWARTDLALHISVTLQEILIGLILGGGAGVIVGLILGRALVMGPILRPIIFGLYSIPIIALAPLFILWFGLDMMPKIVLVMISAFFLLFFNTFSGVQAIDKELIAAMRLMGADRGEEFRKIIAPGAMSWIVSGFKIATPYAFAAAVTGELLAARQGIGSLLSKAAAQFDMTGLYAGLFVLMILGVMSTAGVLVLERRLLRWRPAAE
jgi:NitT/TauT family transport system permease protein